MSFNLGGTSVTLIPEAVHEFRWKFVDARWLKYESIILVFRSANRCVAYLEDYVTLENRVYTPAFVSACSDAVPYGVCFVYHHLFSREDVGDD